MAALLLPSLCIAIDGGDVVISLSDPGPFRSGMDVVQIEYEIEKFEDFSDISIYYAIIEPDNDWHSCELDLEDYEGEVDVEVECDDYTIMVSDLDSSCDFSPYSGTECQIELRIDWELPDCLQPGDYKINTKVYEKATHIEEEEFEIEILPDLDCTEDDCGDGIDNDADGDTDCDDSDCEDDPDCGDGPPDGPPDEPPDGPPGDGPPRGDADGEAAPPKIIPPEKPPSDAEEIELEVYDYYPDDPALLALAIPATGTMVEIETPIGEKLELPIEKEKDDTGKVVKAIVTVPKESVSGKTGNWKFTYKNPKNPELMDEEIVEVFSAETINVEEPPEPGKEPIPGDSTVEESASVLPWLGILLLILVAIITYYLTKRMRKMGRAKSEGEEVEEL